MAAILLRARWFDQPKRTLRPYANWQKKRLHFDLQPDSQPYMNVLIYIYMYIYNTYCSIMEK